MSTCKRCHEPVLINDDGYCFNCVKETNWKIQECRNLADDLLQQSQQILTDAQRLDLLDQGKKLCNDLKQLSKTPYYKGNLKQEIRNILYIFGGTERDYHEIIGYRGEVSYLLSVAVSAALVFGSIFMLLANFAPPPSKPVPGESTESAEVSSMEEITLPDLNAGMEDGPVEQQEPSDEPLGIDDDFNPDDYIMQPMEI